MAFKLPERYSKPKVETISGMDLSDYKKYLTGIKKLFNSYSELKSEIVNTGWLTLTEAGHGVLKSDSGNKISTEDLPEELKGVKGEYGCASIQLSDIIFYNPNVIKKCCLCKRRRFRKGYRSFLSFNIFIVGPEDEFFIKELCTYNW